MGAVGSLLQEGDRQEIEDVTKEVLQTFQDAFTEILKERLTYLITNEPQEEPGTEQRLKSCPQLSNPLKLGFLFKRGNINQGWRRRWCTAANGADNFVVSYYDEPGSARPNGSIDCAFCNVIPFNEKETEEAGQYGFKVQPRFMVPSSHERVWYLRAESENDMNCWVQLLTYAIRNATPRGGFEDAMSYGLERALLVTALRFEVYGMQSITGEELDVVLQLVTRVLQARVLERVIDRNASARRDRERDMKRLVDLTTELVYDHVRNSWSVMSQALLRQKTKYTEDINRQLPELKGTRESIRQAFLAQQGDVVRTQLANVTEEACVPLLPRIMPLLIAAVVKVITALFRKLYDLMHANDAGLLILSDAIAAAHLNIDRFDWNQSDADLMIVNKLCERALPRELDLDSIYFRKLQAGLLDGIRKIQHDSVHSLESNYPGGMVNSGWRQDFDKLLEDATADVVALVQGQSAAFLQDVVVPIVYKDKIQPMVRTTGDEFALILSDLPEDLRCYANPTAVIEQQLAEMISTQLRQDVMNAYPTQTEVVEQVHQMIHQHKRDHSNRLRTPL